MRKILPITQDFHGAKIRVTQDGKKFWTPMIVVFLIFQRRFIQGISVSGLKG